MLGGGGRGGGESVLHVVFPHPMDPLRAFHFQGRRRLLGKARKRMRIEREGIHFNPREREERNKGSKMYMYISIVVQEQSPSIFPLSSSVRSSGSSRPSGGGCTYASTSISRDLDLAQCSLSRVWRRVAIRSLGNATAILS